MGAPVQMEVRAIGFTDARKALRLVAPDMARRMTTGLRAQATGIAQMTRARAPRRTGAMAAGYKVKTIPARVGPFTMHGGYQVRNDTRQAAILESAGSRSPGKPNQGRSLVRNLNDRYGPPGRFLWRTWDEQRATVLAAVDGLIRQAERDLQTRINQAAR